jgi:hypothetical protein
MAPNPWMGDTVTDGVGAYRHIHNNLLLINLNRQSLIN